MGDENETDSEDSFNSLESLVEATADSIEDEANKIDLLIISDSTKINDNLIEIISFNISLKGVQKIKTFQKLLVNDFNGQKELIKNSNQVLFIISEEVLKEDELDIFLKILNICIEDVRSDIYFFACIGREQKKLMSLFTDKCEEVLETRKFEEVITKIYNFLSFNLAEPYLSSFALKSALRVEKLLEYRIIPFNCFKNFSQFDEVNYTEEELKPLSLLETMKEFNSELSNKLKLITIKLNNALKSLDEGKNKIIVLNSRCETINILLTIILQECFFIYYNNSTKGLYHISKTINLTNLSLFNFGNSLKNIEKNGNFLIFYEFDRNIAQTLSVQNFLKTILTYLAYYFKEFEIEMLDLLQTMCDKFEKKQVNKQPYLLLELFVQVFEVNDIFRRIKKNQLDNSENEVSNQVVILIEGAYWLPESEHVIFSSLVYNKLIMILPDFVRIIVTNDYVEKSFKDFPKDIKRIDLILSEEHNNSLVKFHCDIRVSAVYEKLILAQSEGEVDTKLEKAFKEIVQVFKDLRGSVQSLRDLHNLFVQTLKIACDALPNKIFQPATITTRRIKPKKKKKSKFIDLFAVLVSSREYLPMYILQQILSSKNNILVNGLLYFTEILLQLCYSMVVVNVGETKVTLLAPTMGISKYLKEDFAKLTQRGHSLLSKFSVEYLSADVHTIRRKSNVSTGTPLNEVLHGYLIRNIFYHLSFSEIKNNQQRLGLLNVILSDTDFLLKFILFHDSNDLDDFKKLINKTIAENNDDELLIFDITLVFDFVLQCQDYVKLNPEEVFNQILFRFNLKNIYSVMEDKAASLPELVCATLVNTASKRSKLLTNTSNTNLRTAFSPDYPAYSHTYRSCQQETFKFALQILSNLSKIALTSQAIFLSNVQTFNSNILTFTSNDKKIITSILTNKHTLISFDLEKEEVTQINGMTTLTNGSKSRIVNVRQCSTSEVLVIEVTQSEFILSIHNPSEVSTYDLCTIELEELRKVVPDKKRLFDFDVVANFQILLLKFNKFMLLLDFNKIYMAWQLNNRSKLEIMTSEVEKYLLSSFEFSENCFCINPFFDLKQKKQEATFLTQASSQHILSYNMYGKLLRIIEERIENDFFYQKQVNTLFSFKNSGSVDALMAVGFSDGNIQIWNLTSGKSVRFFKAHDSGITKIADHSLNQVSKFAGRENRSSYELLVTSSSDSTVKIFEKKDFLCLKVFRFSFYSIQDFLLSSLKTDVDSLRLRLAIVDASGTLFVRDFYGFELYFHDTIERHKFAAEYRRQSVQKKAIIKKSSSFNNKKITTSSNKKEGYLDLREMWSGVRGAFGKSNKNILEDRTRKRNSKNSFKLFNARTDKKPRDTFSTINYSSILKKKKKKEQLLEHQSSIDLIEEELTGLGFSKLNEEERSTFKTQQPKFFSHDVTCMSVSDNSDLLCILSYNSEILVRSVKYGLTMNINRPEYFTKIKNFEEVFDMYSKAKAAEERYNNNNGWARDTYFGDWGHKSIVAVSVFSKNSRYLATGCDDGRVCLWDCNNEFILIAQYAHRSGVVSLAFDSKTLYLASGSYDQTIKVWSLVDSKTLLKYQANTEGARKKLRQTKPRESKLKRTNKIGDKRGSLRNYKTRTSGFDYRKKKRRHKRISVVTRKDMEESIEHLTNKKSLHDDRQWNQSHLLASEGTLKGPLNEGLSIQEGNGTMNSVCFNPKLNLFAACCVTHFGALKVWSFDHNKQDFAKLVHVVHKPALGDQYPSVVFFSANGRYLICGCEQSTKVESSHLVVVYEISRSEGQKFVFRRAKALYIPGTPEYLYLGLSLDNRFLAETCKGKKTVYWDLKSSKPVQATLLSTEKRRASFIDLNAGKMTRDFSPILRDSKNTEVSDFKGHQDLILSEVTFQTHHHSSSGMCLQSYPSQNSMEEGKLIPFSGDSSPDCLQLDDKTKATLGDYVIDTFNNKFSIVKVGLNVHIFRNVTYT